MPIVIREIKKKNKKGMGEEKIPAKNNMGMDSMQPKKKKADYKMKGGKMSKYYSKGGTVFTGR